MEPLSPTLGEDVFGVGGRASGFFPFNEAIDQGSGPLSQGPKSL